MNQPIPYTPPRVIRLNSCMSGEGAATCVSGSNASPNCTHNGLQAYGKIGCEANGLSARGKGKCISGLSVNSIG